MDKLSWRTEQRKIKDLIPTEGNPRQLTKEQAKQLQESLEKFNLVDIPACNTDNRIISGHQRLAILRAMGRANETVDVRVPSRRLTEAEHREYLLRANKNLGEWDFDLLAGFGEELLKGIGFDSKELDKIFQLEPDAKDDDVPAVRRTNIKRGDLFILGKHRVLCGDATNKEDVAKLMDGKKADMVFTDPPYGVSYGDKNKFLNAVGRGNRIQENLKNDTLSPEKSKELWLGAWKQLYTIMKDGACYYICSADSDLMMMMMMSITEAGLELRQSLVWVKNNIVLGRRDYKCQHENILYGWKGGAGHKFYGKGGASSVWEIDKPHQSKLHPTMKPVELCEKGIVNSSMRGGIVLDLFLGSGSTLIACEKTNRVCYGMEIDTHYTDVIVSRWCKFTGRTDVIKNGKKIRWEVPNDQSRP